MFMTLVVYVVAVFVLIVQPLRLVWGMYTAIAPPKDRYLNYVILGISLFIKVVSLLLSGYIIHRFGSDVSIIVDFKLMKYMIIPFVIYVMSELVVRFIHCRSSDKI